MAKFFKDLLGQRFGSLEVLKKSGSTKNGVYWEVRCDCGVEKRLRGDGLRNGKSVSCGCKRVRTPITDLTGRKFGKRLVLSLAPSYASSTTWRVRCDCGTESEVRGSLLLRGVDTSCGCARNYKHSVTHGESSKGSMSLEYGAWRKMKSRATALGMEVCEEWRNSYEKFLLDMGRKPTPQHTLDRIDGTEGYKPINCRWATRTEQAQNINSNILIVYKGEELCRAAWARRYNLANNTLKHRLAQGWDIERALTTPPKPTTDARAVNSVRLATIPEYKSWANMRRRCRDTKHVSYADYGGRGITVCEEWNQSFEAFLADMGPKTNPADSLDRIDSNGDYCAANCRWADKYTQNRNKRSNRYATYKGETKLTTEWEKELGLSAGLVLARLKAGWSVEQTLATPVAPRQGNAHGKAG